MAENSAISWTDDTFNPWEGCQKVGPGCDGCYAEARNARYSPKGSNVAPNWGPGAPRRRTSVANWNKPLKWDREQAAKAWRRAVGMRGGERIWEYAASAEPMDGWERSPPRFVFCASLADVFDNAVPVEWRRDLFDLIRATPDLTWLLLTKRPGNIVRLFREATELDQEHDALAEYWPPNAAIGCTIVNQTEADRDVMGLLEAKRALNPAFAFLSMEPLLGRVDLTRIKLKSGAHAYFDALRGVYDIRGTARELPNPMPEPMPTLDWVIVGGETDQGDHLARPMHPRWVADLWHQCKTAGVPFHLKQWGKWLTFGEGYPGYTPGRDGGELSTDGKVLKGNDLYFWGNDQRDWPISAKVGKRIAGRSFDGVTHDARPLPRAA